MSLADHCQQARIIDTVAIAEKAGLLQEDNALTGLMTCWSALYEGTPEQSCDSDAEKGLTKTWVYMVECGPLMISWMLEMFLSQYVVMGLPFMIMISSLFATLPSSTIIRTQNIYFGAPGPIFEDQAARLVKLAQSPAPTHSESLRCANSSIQRGLHSRSH